MDRADAYLQMVGTLYRILQTANAHWKYEPPSLRLPFLSCTRNMDDVTRVTHVELRNDQEGSRFAFYDYFDGEDKPALSSPERVAEHVQNGIGLLGLLTPQQLAAQFVEILSGPVLGPVYKNLRDLEQSLLVES